jgi:lipopolysaccharide heptosyltransferase I
LEPKHILVVKLSSIGDTVHAIPSVASLRERFPEARIDWCVEERCAPLVECLPMVDRVIRLRTRVWRRGKSLLGPEGLPEFLRALRAAPYDAGIDFQGLWKSAVVLRLSRSRERIGWASRWLREPGAARFYTTAVDQVDPGTHVIGWCAALLRPLGIESVSWKFPIRLPEAAVREADGLWNGLGRPRFILVNPGAGWPTKQWAPDRFGQLCARVLRETGLVPLVSRGPGEAPLVEAVREHCPGAVSVNVNLTVFAALAAKAACFVGGDTGPMHLASAMGTPVVALFGPSDPARNGPFHPRDVVLHRRLPCSGSYRRRCPDAEHKCMNFTVDEVFEAVSRRLAQEKEPHGN